MERTLKALGSERVARAFLLAKNARTLQMLAISNAVFAVLFHEAQREMREYVRAGKPEDSLPPVWFELQAGRDPNGTLLRGLYYDFVMVMTETESIGIPAKLLSSEALHCIMKMIVHVGNIKSRGDDDNELENENDFQFDSKFFSSDVVQKMRRELVAIVGDPLCIFEACCDVLDVCSAGAAPTLVIFAPEEVTLKGQRKCAGECTALIRRGWGFKDTDAVFCDHCGSDLVARREEIIAAVKGHLRNSNNKRRT